MSIPERVGRFRILGRLGEGGMGVVYEAHDDELDRTIAVKVLARGDGDETARRRFRREAKAAARIRHPNVCQLFDIGEERGRLFIAMERLEGESLAARLTRGSLPAAEAIQVQLEILSALGALHEERIVHRDLKPSNVFLTRHGAKLLDFGLARTAQGDPDTQEATKSQLTLAGGVVGTPHYMSPEQFQGGIVDERSDLFAAGVMLFEMVTGRRPFPGRTPMEIYHSVVYDPAPSLGGSAQARALDRVIRRSLSKRREERFQSADEMAFALRQMLEIGGPQEAPQVRAVTRLIVLPFRVLRSDLETDFLALSIPDAIATSLAGLETLLVRSSAAAARFTEEAPDLERIAREAAVDVVLTGTLLRSGDQIRVAAQLLSAPDGTLLWSHTPQVGVRDVFQLQDDIVNRIVTSLSPQLSARESRMLKRNVPTSATAYELYLRGNQIILQGLRGGEALDVARDLLLRCVEEDPNYAPGWARLGRCYWLIGKGAERGHEMLARAEDCFEKALSLNPDLPLAHNLYAQLLPDLGKAVDAITRLLGRIEEGSSEPELFAALLHACRYCGLLEASLAAHERARSLDPLVPTSVNHTLFQLGDTERAMKEMGRGTFYLDSVILFQEGKRDEALRLLREREAANLPEVTRALVTSLRALVEGKRKESLEATYRAFSHFPDPEGMHYMARQLAFWGEVDDAISKLEEVLERGFIPYRVLTRPDPWLDSLRRSKRFRTLLRVSAERYQDARARYAAAGGERLLGPGA